LNQYIRTYRRRLMHRNRAESTEITIVGCGLVRSLTVRHPPSHNADTTTVPYLLPFFSRETQKPGVETCPVPISQTTRRHIPEDHDLIGKALKVWFFLYLILAETHNSIRKQLQKKLDVEGKLRSILNKGYRRSNTVQHQLVCHFV
jgi:hypothetical protein